MFPCLTPPHLLAEQGSQKLAASGLSLPLSLTWFLSYYWSNECPHTAIVQHKSKICSICWLIRVVYGESETFPLPHAVDEILLRIFLVCHVNFSSILYVSRLALFTSIIIMLMVNSDDYAIWFRIVTSLLCRSSGFSMTMALSWNIDPGSYVEQTAIYLDLENLSTLERKNE